MIRRSCIACGRSINRTDQFFEPSDGTLCRDCQARLATAKLLTKRDAASLGQGHPVPGGLLAMTPLSVRQR